MHGVLYCFWCVLILVCRSSQQLGRLTWLKGRNESRRWENAVSSWKYLRMSSTGGSSLEVIALDSWTLLHFVIAFWFEVAGEVVGLEFGHLREVSHFMQMDWKDAKYRCSQWMQASRGETCKLRWSSLWSHKSSFRIKSWMPSPMIDLPQREYFIHDIG